VEELHWDLLLKTMGAKMPPPHRLFSWRNPFARTVFVAVAVLLVMALTLRTDAYDVRGHLMKGAGSKQTVPAQHPLDLEVPVAPEGSSYDDEPPQVTHVPNCDVDTEHLADIQERFGLDQKFQYLKRYIKFTRTPSLQRKSVTKTAQKFLPKKFKTVDVRKTYRSETCMEPLEVPVPESSYPTTANASEFMFAVSTTYKRFNETKTSPIKEWSYWLTDSKGHTNGGKLLLLLLDATDAQLEDAGKRLRRIGIDVDVYHSDASMEMAVRYLTLVPTLYNHPDRKSKKWLVTCDDDTFFPSMHGLISRFASLDHTQPLYVGTLSEDVNALDRHGSQAFGGAGVFLSIPLAAKLNSLYEGCKTDEKVRESNSGWGPQGDILLRKCIYENTEVRLTTIWDLWQLDLYGDPSGFYESGIKPLSLHHYKGGGWHLAHPLASAKVAHLCGEDCTFMRFQTADDFILSTGYSVAHYPKGIDFNLDQMERTFSAAPEDKGWNLDFMFGPQRRSLHKTGRKIAWELQDSTLNEDGSVLQIYTRKKDDWRWVEEEGDPMSKMDGIIELVWIPSEG
jgi:hypothetical protein